MIGGGVTVSNIQFSGNNQQIGYFSNGNSIGMSSGIVMSSGHAVDADLGGNPLLIILQILESNVIIFQIQFVMIYIL